MNNTLDYAPAHRESPQHWLTAEVQRFVARPGRWWGYYMATAQTLDPTFDAEPFVAQLRIAPMQRSQWTFIPGNDTWEAWVAFELGEAESEQPGAGRGILLSRVRRPGSPADVRLIDHLQSDYAHLTTDAFVQFIEVQANANPVVSG